MAEGSKIGEAIKTVEDRRQLDRGAGHRVGRKVEHGLNSGRGPQASIAKRQGVWKYLSIEHNQLGISTAAIQLPRAQPSRKRSLYSGPCRGHQVVIVTHFVKQDCRVILCEQLHTHLGLASIQHLPAILYR